METTKCTIMYGTNAKCRFSYQSMEEWVYSTVCYRRYEKAYVRPTCCIITGQTLPFSVSSKK